jgi:death-on-curing protein
VCLDEVWGSDCIESSDGSARLRDLRRLEPASATQIQNIFGEELYVVTTDKAATIFHGIIADHDFIDGNKRTAMLAGLTLLSINGFDYMFKKEEVENFAVKIASHRLDVPQISFWLHAHIK